MIKPELTKEQEYELAKQMSEAILEKWRKQELEKFHERMVKTAIDQAVDDYRIYRFSFRYSINPYAVDFYRLIP